MEEKRDEVLSCHITKRTSSHLKIYVRIEQKYFIDPQGENMSLGDMRKDRHSLTT